MPTSKTAKITSIVFFTAGFEIKTLMELPNNTQMLIEGKFTIGAIQVKNRSPVIKLSSFGKKTLTAVIAITHALGFKI